MDSTQSHLLAYITWAVKKDYFVRWFASSLSANSTQKSESDQSESEVMSFVVFQISHYNWFLIALNSCHLFHQVATALLVADLTGYLGRLCIHQLVLSPRSKAVASLWLIPVNAPWYGCHHGICGITELLDDHSNYDYCS